MKKPSHAVLPGVGAEQEAQPAPGAHRILIVDDEESIRELFGGLFRPPDYYTLAAPNGMTAVALASEHIFDLAFIDFKMPDMNGVETSKRLREIQPSLKTVLISGYLVEDRANAVEEARAQAFLAKPFSAAAVRSLAERLLGITAHKS